MLPARRTAASIASNFDSLAQADAASVLLSKPSRTMVCSGSPFYRPFAALSELRVEDRTRIQQAARKLVDDRIAPALATLRRIMNDEYLPACPEAFSLAKWANGPEVYRVLLRGHVTLPVDPAAAHEAGKREVDRIRKAIADVLVEVKYEGGLDSFLASAASDPRFCYTREGDLIAAHSSALSRIRAALPRVVLNTDVPPLAVKDVERGGIAAMYNRIPETVVIVDVGKLEIRPKFEVLPLMLHEGMPGHHLQISMSSVAAEDLYTLWLRQSAAYSEGWALYAETLGREMGLLEDPYDRFGQLGMSLMRAVRVVVDTGIHVHGWMPEEATAYFLRQTGKTKAMADLEVLRSAWPGMVPTYKLGEEWFQSMRQRAEQTLGPRFDLRSFHDALLRWGPLPLEVLELRVDRCLKQPSCADFRSPAVQD